MITLYEIPETTFFRIFMDKTDSQHNLSKNIIVMLLRLKNKNLDNSTNGIRKT